MLPSDFLEDAVRFHGHLGSFLVLGLRAGLIGVRHLGRSYIELRATVETAPSPPRSCFIDGIQFASSCTLGKGNIEFKPSNRVAVTFVRDGRRVEVVAKDATLRELDQISSHSQAEKLCEELLRRADDELFTVRLE